MKIAIITLPFHVNYGGYLQAYALQSVLKEIGHKVSIIMIDKSPQWRIWVSYIKWKIQNLFRNQYGIEDSFKDFLMLKINKKYFAKVGDIKENDFDAYVVGSDQVWRKKFIKDLSFAFLAFAKPWRVKRIAYAPSFGISEWDYTDDETTMCRELLSIFDFVSIREDSGVELCKKHFGVIPTVVLDPTLIAPKKVYMSLLNRQKIDVGAFIYYVKKNEAILDVNELLEKLGYKNYKEVILPCENYPIKKLPTVSKWLSYIAYADIVLTDSFHACVFCLLFHKPFLVMPSGWGGKSRFQTLLAPLGLENHILTEFPTENITSYLNKKIDWADIDSKLNDKRNISLSFLKNCF